MDESNTWGLRRNLTALAVSLLHLVLVAVLLETSRSRGEPAATAESVQLLFLPPVDLPKARSTLERPQHVRAATAVALAPLPLDSLAPVSEADASSSAGRGSGVDWTAEARRALNAFEIRGHQPTANASVSKSAEDDSWWPQAHHAGEQYKTAGGDWIVWIDANCYQVASAGPSAYSTGASLPKTLCRANPGEAPK